MKDIIKHRNFRYILPLLVLVLLWGCDRKPTGIAIVGNENFPDPPENVTILVGDRFVKITWTHPDTASIQTYHIYRSAGTDSAYSFVDSTTARQFVDQTVQNDVTYYYRISAVNSEGFEGRRSTPVAAIPTFFDLAIENGADYTGSRTVKLTLSASPSTAFMMLSNDSTFSGAQQEPFINIASWALTIGDGTKTVFARFQDASGNETSAPVKDSIVLDTRAIINAVTESTGGATKAAGDTIHFTIDTGETAGQASINIENGPNAIPLFDDGSRGDTVAGDGIYEVDFIVPSDADVFEGRVSGDFTDRVGNKAAQVYTGSRITIKRAPAPVTLFAPILVEGSKVDLTLNWTQSQEKNDFASYLLYRSQAPGITPETATLVTSISSKSKTSYVDAGLFPNSLYYYRIYVLDFTGLSTASNEVVGATSSAEPPAPVFAYAPFIEDNGSVTLTWTESQSKNFASYRIFRSTAPGVNVKATLRGIISSQKKLAFTDIDVQDGQTYYYRIYVYDNSGLNTGSNEVTIATPVNLPPTPVILASPTIIDQFSLRLTWTQNTDTDFSHYSIYRSQSSPVDIAGTPLQILTGKPNVTDFVDQNLTPQTQYFYVVVVFDMKGLSASSNEVSGTTK